MLFSYIQPMLDSLAEAATSTTSPISSSTSVSELTTAFDVATYVLVAIGVFMLIVGVVGCAGACCSVKVLLATVGQT